MKCSALLPVRIAEFVDAEGILWLPAGFDNSAFHVCDPVSIQVLRAIALQPLPVMVPDGGSVDAVRVLFKAGLVKAVIPRPQRTVDGYEQLPAMVTEITHLGRMMLRRFPKP